jgi:hypothetical protein
MAEDCSDMPLCWADELEEDEERAKRVAERAWNRLIEDCAMAPKDWTIDEEDYEGEEDMEQTVEVNSEWKELELECGKMTDWSEDDEGPTSPTSASSEITLVEDFHQRAPRTLHSRGSSTISLSPQLSTILETDEEDQEDIPQVATEKGLVELEPGIFLCPAPAPTLPTYLTETPKADLVEIEEGIFICPPPGPTKTHFWRQLEPDVYQVCYGEIPHPQFTWGVEPGVFAIPKTA